ncbi:MAG: spore coat U domain-containing protein [Hyphomonadaceae bacterium]|nr:spore coat U domain-containing protein [Hyphomonadaceae bacterium]
MRGLALCALGALALLASAAPARALCVLCSCTVNANPLSFGSFAPLSGAPRDAATTVDVSCTGVSALSAIEIRMNAGVYGTIANRRMRSSGNDLAYNIYTNAARTTIWGDDTGGYAAVTVTNTLGLVAWSSSTTAYGRASPAPSTPPGAYGDTIVVTVEW